MIRTGAQYRDSIRDGRQVYIGGERVKDVTTHPMFKPLVDIRARFYDMQHEPATRDIMSYGDGGETHAIANKLPYTQADWWAKRRATDALLEEVGGVVTRVGDETVGEMWSLFDGQDVLDEVDPQFSKNIRNHVGKVLRNDPFHVSANTDPKGDRSKPPQEQDPDMLLHVVKETDAGHRRARREVRDGGRLCQPGLHQAHHRQLGQRRAVGLRRGLHLRFQFAQPQIHLPHGLCRPRAQGGLSARQPLRRGRCAGDLRQRPDPLGERPVLPAHQGRHRSSASTLHRYSAFAFTQRVLKLADMMIGAALFNVRQTGLDKQQAVQEKLAELAVYREGINAHLTASIALAERSPGGLMMPNQSLLFTGRVLACSQLHHMMHIARELCGGQICVTPDKAAFDAPETKPWLDKYYTVNEGWLAEDRRKLLAFARDLLNSDYAGHRLTFQLFAQSPPFAQPGRGLSQLRLGRPAGVRPQIGRPVGAGSGLGRS